MDLKIEWAEETTWGQHLEGLKTGRFDMLCVGSFTLPTDAQSAETIGPLYYSTIGVWARRDDHRFDADYTKINKPDITVSAIDGTIPAIIAAEQFPQAKILSQPEYTDYSVNMLNVASRKADVTFVEGYQGEAYELKNPGTLRDIAASRPLRIFPNNILVAKGEIELQSMFNNVLSNMTTTARLTRLSQGMSRGGVSCCAGRQAGGQSRSSSADGSTRR